MAKNEKKKDSSLNESEKIENSDSVAIPTVKELTKDEIIQMYKEEIKKKDDIIANLQNENRLLLELSMKNAKRRMEELEIQIKNQEQKK